MTGGVDGEVAAESDKAVRVRFTGEGGAKRHSDGQLVFSTLHGVVRQPGQRVQLLPGVGGGRDAFV